MKKKLLSIVLTLAMVLTMLPLSALAASWTVTLNGNQITLTEDAEGNITAEGDGAQYYTFKKTGDAEADSFEYYELATGKTGNLDGVPVTEGTVETPVIDPNGGEVESGATVTITCATTGAKIYYTTDGTDPTASSTEYTTAIEITDAVTIKAIAVKDGMTNSAVASAEFTIKADEPVEAPIFTPAAGEVEANSTVAISAAAGAEIRYTTDGTEPTATSGEVYSQPITIASAITIKAVAVVNGVASEVVEAAYTVAAPGTVAAPIFTPADGTEVEPGATVAITSATTGATIYYTTDGTEPTASSTEYTAAIEITDAVTIKAIAVKEGMTSSAVVSASYTVKTAPIETVEAPIFSLADGTEVEPGATVTITSATTGATIYYTTDGTEPTASSTEYTTAIEITDAVTIKAIAVKEGMTSSAVVSASYTVKTAPAEQVEAPVIAPASKTVEIAGGQTEATVNVTITCDTADAAIWYTTDGSEPTGASEQYTQAFDVTVKAGESVTVKAIAVKDGMEDSEIVSATYTAPKIEGNEATVGTTETTTGEVTVDTDTVDKNADALAESAAKEGENVVINVSGAVTDDTLQKKEVQIPLSDTLVKAMAKKNVFAVDVVLTENVSLTMPTSNLSSSATSTLKVQTTEKGISLKMGDAAETKFDTPVKVNITVNVTIENPVVAYLKNGHHYRVRQDKPNNGAFSFFTRHFSDFEVVAENETEAVDLVRTGTGTEHYWELEQDETLVVALKSNDNTYRYVLAIMEDGELGEKTWTPGVDLPDGEIAAVASVIGKPVKGENGEIQLGDPTTVMGFDADYADVL